MQKVNEILRRVPWSEIKPDNWQVALEVAFIALLNSLALGKKSDSKEWLGRVTEFLEIIDVESLSFDPMREPAEIHTSFKYDSSSGIGSDRLITMIEKLLDASNRKITLMKGDVSVEIEQIHKKIKFFHTYLLQFPHNLGIKEYLSKRRKDYPQEMTNLKAEYDKYLGGYSEERKNVINQMLKEVETQELSKIYGGRILTFKI